MLKTGMMERFGGPRDDRDLTHIQIINGIEGSSAWIPGHPPFSPADPLYDEDEMNQGQVKELLDVLHAIDGKLELLLQYAQKPAPPVIGAGLLPDGPAPKSSSSKKE